MKFHRTISLLVSLAVLQASAGALSSCPNCSHTNSFNHGHHTHVMAMHRHLRRDESPATMACCHTAPELKTSCCRSYQQPASLKEADRVDTGSVATRTSRPSTEFQPAQSSPQSSWLFVPHTLVKPSCSSLRI